MCEQEVFDALKYRIVVNKYGTPLLQQCRPAIEFGNGNEYLLHIAGSAPIIDRCGRTQALQ